MDIQRAIDTLLNLEALLPHPTNTGQRGRSSSTSKKDPKASGTSPPPIPAQSQPQQPQMPNNDNPYSSIVTIRAQMNNSQQPQPSPSQPSEVTTNLVPIDQQILRAASQGDTQMVLRFFKDVRPHLTREMQQLFNSCVNICIERGNVPLMCIFLDNGASADGDSENARVLYAYRTYLSRCTLH